MCNTTQPDTPRDTRHEAQKDPALSTLDKEIQRATLELRLAELRTQADFNASVAGQMQRQFETYQRIAKPLSESQFVPEAYKGNIGNCVIAVEMAARLGVMPLAVMQNLCIVKGKPTWMSKFLIGCVNSCGRYTTLDYQITLDGTVGDITYKTWQKDERGKNREILVPFEHPDLDNLVCIAFATEIKTGKVLRSTPVSIRMAVQEGWYTKDGSKWPSMPEQMLRYRAASFWVSAFAPEMSMGFRTTEEQRDIIDTDYEEVTTTAPDTRPVPTKKRPTTDSVEQAKERLRARPSKNEPAPDNTRPSQPSDTPQPTIFDMP